MPGSRSFPRHISSGLLALALLDAVALVKAVNASRSVNKLLLAGIEGVAGRTDFHADFRGNGRTGLDDITADADNLTVFVFRMNTFLHNNILLFLPDIEANPVSPTGSVRCRYHSPTVSKQVNTTR